MTSLIDFSGSPCPCGGRYACRTIKVPPNVDADAEQLTDVLQGVCGSCGSKVYHAETLERVESTLKGRSPDGIVNRPS